MELNNELEFKKEMESTILTHSTIGVHGLNINDNNMIEQISSILSKGLFINHPSGMVGNIAFYGTTDDWGYKEIYDYAYYSASSDKFIVNFIVAIPETLTTSNGDNYLVCLGDAADYRKNKGLQNYNQNALDNWLNQYISVKKCLPKEFIVGTTITDKISGKTSFAVNKSYYGNLSDDQKMKCSDNLINDLLNTEYCYPHLMYKITDNNLVSIKKTKDANGNNTFQDGEFIDLGDLNKALEDIDGDIELYKSYNINSFYLEQVKEYLNRQYAK